MAPFILNVTAFVINNGLKKTELIKNFISDASLNIKCELLTISESLHGKTIPLINRSAIINEIFKNAACIAVQINDLEFIKFLFQKHFLNCEIIDQIVLTAAKCNNLKVLKFVFHLSQEDLSEEIWQAYQNEYEQFNLIDEESGLLFEHIPFSIENIKPTIDILKQALKEAENIAEQDSSKAKDMQPTVKFLKRWIDNDAIDHQFLEQPADLGSDTAGPAEV
jgi:hypothetical protein